MIKDTHSPAFLCPIHGFTGPGEVRIRRQMRFKEGIYVAMNVLGCKEKKCDEPLSVIPMYAKCPSCGKELGFDDVEAFFNKDSPDDGWTYEDPPGIWLHCEIKFGWSFRRMLSFILPTRWRSARHRRLNYNNAAS